MLFRSRSVKYDASKIAERLRDHSLYIAFAPADKPKIALAVIVENAGFGAAAAAPIARQAIDYYLLGKRPDEPAKPVTKPVTKPAAADAANASTAPSKPSNDPAPANPLTPKPAATAGNSGGTGAQPQKPAAATIKASPGAVPTQSAPRSTP